MTRDEWKEWLAKSWDEAQARASTPEQKPVAHITGYYRGHCVIEPIDRATVLPVGMALYRAPAECVRMTDEEMDEVVNRLQQEQALKEKNT
jgi:hypothetical protein